MLKPCSDGKIRNPATHRCVNEHKTKRTNVRKPCKHDTVRNSLTNRCVKVRIIKQCKDGKVRNPTTNRCVNIQKNKTRRKKRLSGLFARSPSTDLNEADRMKFDGILKELAEAVGKAKPDYETCVAAAPIDILRNEMKRRGFQTQSPVINNLIPRRKKKIWKRFDLIYYCVLNLCPQSIQVTNNVIGSSALRHCIA
jgi:hypothetical protein